MTINELRTRVNNELHRNSDDLYWQVISELLEIIEIQQDFIKTIEQRIEFLDAVIEDVKDVE